MDAYEAVTSVLEVVNWSASHPYRFTPGERDPVRSGRCEERRTLLLPGI
jgi:hypothetical protein